MKVHHIGYAVKNLEKAIDDFSSLGYRLVSDIVDDAIRNVRICFMENGGYIELVAPLTDGSDVSGVLRGKVSGPITFVMRLMTLQIRLQK